MPEIQNRAASHARALQRSKQEAAKRTIYHADQAIRSMKNGIPDVLDEVKRLETSLSILFPGVETLLSEQGEERESTIDGYGGSIDSVATKKRVVWVKDGMEVGDFDVNELAEEEEEDKEVETVSGIKNGTEIAKENAKDAKDREKLEEEGNKECIVQTGCNVDEDDVEWEEDDLNETKSQPIRQTSTNSLTTSANPVKLRNEENYDEFLDNANRKRRRQLVEDVGSAPFTLTIQLPSRATDVQSSDNAVLIRGMRETYNHLDSYSLPRLIDWLQALNKAVRLNQQECLGGGGSQGGGGNHGVEIEREKMLVYQEGVKKVLDAIKSVNAVVNGRCKQLLAST